MVMTQKLYNRGTQPLQIIIVHAKPSKCHRLLIRGLQYLHNLPKDLVKLKGTSASKDSKVMLKIVKHAFVYTSRTTMLFALAWRTLTLQDSNIFERASCNETEYMERQTALRHLRRYSSANKESRCTKLAHDANIYKYSNKCMHLHNLTRISHTLVQISERSHHTHHIHAWLLIERV